MIHTIRNSFLSIEVSSFGGELQSIKTSDGTQYLWQGDPATWNDRAPNIFPYVARLTDGKYTYKGKTYQMDIHGFLKDSEMACEENTEDTLILYLEDDAHTIEQYPFSFRLTLAYVLDGPTLTIAYTVENRNQEIMYFGLGGHPGFHVPMDEHNKFENYYLQFEDTSRPRQLIFTEDCFDTGKDRDFLLQGNNCLPLHHNMFDNDAIILTGAGSKVHLKTDDSSRSVLVDFSDFAYLGLWHFPRTEVDYICIEPWTSLPSRKGIIEDLEHQENLISLAAGLSCSKKWSICIQ